MDRNKSLEYLANGIYAAYKISEIMNSGHGRDGGNAERPDSAANLSRMLTAVSERAPGMHKAILDQTIEQCNLFLDTYRNLKNHYRTNIKTRNDKEDLLTTIHIMKPLLSSRSRTLAENITNLLKSLDSYSKKEQ